MNKSIVQELADNAIILREKKKELNSIKCVKTLYFDDKGVTEARRSQKGYKLQYDAESDTFHLENFEPGNRFEGLLFNQFEILNLKNTIEKFYATKPT